MPIPNDHARLMVAEQNTFTVSDGDPSAFLIVKSEVESG